MKPGTRPLGRVNPRAGFNNYGCRQGKKDFSPLQRLSHSISHIPKKLTQPTPMAYHQTKTQRGQALQAALGDCLVAAQPPYPFSATGQK